MCHAQHVCRCVAEHGCLDFRVQLCVFFLGILPSLTKNQALKPWITNGEELAKVGVKVQQIQFALLFNLGLLSD